MAQMLLSRRRVSERCLRDLIVRHLAFNSNRMFKLVEVISVLNADLVRRILPFLRDHVAITEAKRGTGIDSTLRSVFFIFINLLIMHQTMN